MSNRRMIEGIIIQKNNIQSWEIEKDRMQIRSALGKTYQLLSLSVEKSRETWREATIGFSSKMKLSCGRVPEKPGHSATDSMSLFELSGEPRDVQRNGLGLTREKRRFDFGRVLEFRAVHYFWQTLVKMDRLALFQGETLRVCLNSSAWQCKHTKNFPLQRHAIMFIHRFGQTLRRWMRGDSLIIFANTP